VVRKHSNLTRSTSGMSRRISYHTTRPEAKGSGVFVGMLGPVTV
jgi:hypothetical protein